MMPHNMVKILTYLLAGVALVACSSNTPPSQLNNIENSASAIKSNTGAMELDVVGLPAYRVAATIGEVLSLRVTVSGAQLPSSQTFNIPTNNMVGGRGRVIVGDFLPGDVTVLVEALSSTGEVLGEATTVVTIQASQTVVASVRIKLKPTMINSTKGQTAVDVTLEDGDTVYQTIPTPSPDPAFPDLE